MIPRYLASFVTGVVMTFALLFLMQILIATGKKAVVDEVDFSLGDFIRVKRDEVVNTDESDPEPPPEVEEKPPELPDVQADDFDTSQTLNIGGASGNIDFNLTGGRIGMGEGDYLPIVKVAPIYPRRAQTRGLEGQCLVQFTDCGIIEVSGGTYFCVKVSCKNCHVTFGLGIATLLFEYSIDLLNIVVLGS